jgi:replication factor C subunit 1
MILITLRSGTKNLTRSPFDVTQQLFNVSSFRQSSFIDKIDCYFTDFSMMPLMIQENYIKMKPQFCQESGLQGKKFVANHLELLARAADSISLGNLVESVAQRENSWSMMPIHAVLSTGTLC